MKKCFFIALGIFVFISLPAAQALHAEPTLALVEGDQCKFFPESQYQVKENGVLYPTQVIQNHEKAKKQVKSRKGRSNGTPTPYPDKNLGYSLQKVQKFLKVDIDPNKGKQNIVPAGDKECVQRWCDAQALTQEEYDKLRRPPDQQKAQQPRPEKKVLCVYTPEEAAKSETAMIQAIKVRMESSGPKSGVAKKQAQLAQQFYQTRQVQVAQLSEKFKNMDYAKSKQVFEGATGTGQVPSEPKEGVRLEGAPAGQLDTGNAQVQDTQQALSNNALTQKPEELPKPGSSSESSSPLSGNTAKGVVATGLLGSFLYGWRKYKSNASSVIEAAKHPVDTYSTIQQAKDYEWKQGETRRRVEAETQRTMAKMEEKERTAEAEREKAAKTAERQAEAEKKAQERLEKYKESKARPINNIRTYLENSADPLNAHSEPSDAELLERFKQEELAKLGG